MAEITELNVIILSINEQMGQLELFIKQFHELVNLKDLIITSDAMGTLMVDTPMSLPTDEASLAGKRVLILDNLINTRRESIKSSIDQGLSIYQEIKAINPRFNSLILTKINELNEISSKYNH